jgi:parvulin-like peptidyl-prolyl isomerase
MIMNRLPTLLFAALALSGSVAYAQPDEKKEEKKEGAAEAAPAPTPAPASPGRKKIVIDRVAAVVNDAVILESEVRKRATPLISDLDDIDDARKRQRQWQQLLRQTLDDMVHEELMVQAANEAKLEVTTEEVEKAIAEVKRSNKLTDKQLEDALAQQDYSIAEYRKDLRRQILRLRAQNVLVRPRVQITDEEVKSHYAKIAGQSAAVTEVKLRHILISLPDDASDEAIADARRRAGNLMERVKGGEDFAQVALNASDDVESKASGGELGWFKKGLLPPEWDEVVFDMAVGEVRGPVRGPRGLHVFQVVDTKTEPVRGFEEVKEELRNQLYNDELGKQTKVWLEELRKKAHVEVKM